MAFNVGGNTVYSSIILPLDYNCIANSGLVLHLDAGTTESYPGSGTTWFDMNSIGIVEYLIVAGGGGGGMDMGGGGGAGGVLTGSAAVARATTYTVTVGAGGRGGAAGGGQYRTDRAGPQESVHQFTIGATNGSNSVFNSITAVGGGSGGSSYRAYTPGITGGNGGSGGGSGGYNDNAGTFSGGTGVSGQGYAGGNCTGAYGAAGGGGAGGVGSNGPGASPNGGAGVLSSILGYPLYWGGGGGGGAYSSTPGGNGGAGGGGGGAIGTTTGGAGFTNGQPGGGGSPNAQTNCPGGDAGPNTGGGGGGGSHYNLTNKGGDGGSGIVVIRYPGQQKAMGGTVYYNAGYTIHVFTQSGSFITFDEATLYNSPTYSSNNGGSFAFNGSNTYINMPDNTLLDTQTPSVGVWVKMNSLAQNGFLFEKGEVNTQYSLFINSSNSYLYFRTTHSGTTYDLNYSTSGLSTSLWYYIVGTRDASGNKVLYINGVSVATATQAGTITYNTYGINIGRHSSGYYLNGNIAAIHAYNRTLTAGEVLHNFNALKGRFGY